MRFVLAVVVAVGACGGAFGQGKSPAQSSATSPIVVGQELANQSSAAIYRTIEKGRASGNQVLAKKLMTDLEAEFNASVKGKQAIWKSVVSGVEKGGLVQFQSGWVGSKGYALLCDTNTRIEYKDIDPLTVESKTPIIIRGQIERVEIRNESCVLRFASLTISRK